MSKEEAEALFDEADVNNSGSIDYIEWIQTTIDRKMLLTEEHLKDAFDALDEDHDGSISLDEIKNFLSCGRKIKESTWNKVLGEVDLNNDGQVDFKEFIAMMKSLTQ